jgi:hypothetical protein
VYGKATDFCKGILYPATLLKLFMKGKFLNRKVVLIKVSQVSKRNLIKEKWRGLMPTVYLNNFMRK